MDPPSCQCRTCVRLLSRDVHLDYDEYSYGDNFQTVHSVMNNPKMINWVRQPENCRHDACREAMPVATTSAQVIVADRAIKVTNLDKVLYPATGTTKGEVIAYYQHVAPWFVPLAAGRPATRKRWPNGVGEGDSGAFFEKNLQAKSTPDWVRTVQLIHEDGPKTYPLIDDAATLVWLAQLAALELHVPQWRFDEHLQPQNPDRLVLDLDPGEGASLAQCVEVAHLLREILRDVGFESVPVTSGSKGIHLYAALDGVMTTDEASAFAKELATSLEGLRPDLVVADMKKSLRGGKVLLDWSQNNGNKTTIAPYSLRGRAHPTVATPRTWDEMEPDITQLEFTEVLQRLARDGDPMAKALAPHPSDRLSTYRSMRDAAKTPEPVPEEPPAMASGNSFVIQEHHARRLHYDVRLEHDGVLVSWAVPKGPPLTSDTNHLAVQTEDHPLEYGYFEGDIPKGQYGGGRVSIWDAGSYELEKWRDGKEVIATLHGRADGGLGGTPRKYALLATKLGGDQKNWLIHLMDSEQSAANGGPDSPVASITHLDSNRSLTGIPSYEPMLATAGTEKDLSGRGWHYEIKWDGYRALARVGNGTVDWTSRGGIDLTASYPELAELGDMMAGHQAVLDGEIVALDDQGRSSFELLQNYGRTSTEAHFMVFDLLYLDGKSLVRAPYTERRQALADLFDKDGTHIHVPDTLGTNRQTAMDVSRDLGLEGIVAKKGDSVYQPGKRGSTWVKIKHVRTQEVVVVGWSPGQNSRAASLGSVLLAVHQDDALTYVGKAGSGFSEKQLQETLDVLEGIQTDQPPVLDIPAKDAKGARWVEPLLVGEVSYTEWTSTGRLRHPVWRGWRPDKHAEDVMREGD